MVKGLIGTKIGMSHIYDDKGDMIPVTILEVGPCSIAQIKTLNNDGYEAIQIGYSKVKESHINKAEKNHLSKNGIEPKKHLKEFKNEGDLPILGSELKIEDVFKLNDIVNVTGTSKGRGFQGVIKRYGHHGGPKGHGSRFHRAPGSMGANTFPARVFKGRKLPGRTGGDKKSILNLKIVKIIPEKNLVFISGAIPGSSSSVVIIEKVK